MLEQFAAAAERFAVRRGLWLLFAAALLLLLTGCGPTPAAPSDTPINSFPPDAVQMILNWFVANRHLNWRTGRDTRLKTFDEHRGFFVARRAYRLLGWGPAAWAAEAGYGRVIGRIDSEFGELEAFTTARLNQPGHPGPLTGGTGDHNPPHLDIRDVARQHVNDQATNSTVQTRVTTYFTQRRARAMAIIWRAAGIHEELWQPSADQLTATLRTAAMEELLDRRLHAVERMSYQVSKPELIGAGTINMSAGPSGPWTDGSRIRMFEYPRLGIREFAPGSVGQIADEHGQPPADEWKWESALQRRIVWNHGWSRVRAAAAAGVPVDPTDMYGQFAYARMLSASGGLTPAGALDALFTASTNLWDRSWMYCDHVVASIHLMSLLLAKRRRTGTDAAFDSLVTGNPAGYVRVGPVFAVGGQHLMVSEPDPAFQNSRVAPADFQVGDHVIFWNSILYPLVSTGEWRLENALIVDIESAPEAIANPATGALGSIKLDLLLLQGHGTEGRTIGGYEEKIGNHLRLGMNDARAAARAAGPGATTASHNGDPLRLVRWSPHVEDTWLPPGPWWVNVPVVAPETPAIVRDRLRKGVIPSLYPNPVPAVVVQSGVYFPLWEPQYSGGWEGYLAARAAGPVRVSQRLRETPVDGTIIPGLHYTGGRWESLPVVRPKVVP